MQTDVSMQLALLPDEYVCRSSPSYILSTKGSRCRQWALRTGFGGATTAKTADLVSLLLSAELLAVKQIFIQEELELGNDVSSLSLQRVQSWEQIERELDVLKLLQHHPHPNIWCVLSFYFYIGRFGLLAIFPLVERYGPTVNMFMEYLPAGSLSKLLKEFGPFDEEMVRIYTRDLVQGIVHLHELSIAHRDLKCANLLLADDERGGVKIADFGTAKKAAELELGNVIGEEEDQEQPLKTARSVREGLGSPFWMAPELVRAEKGADSWRKADVWGVGCIVIEMATGKPPWENLSNPLTAMFHIASAATIPEFPAHLSSAAHDFLFVCFDKNPDTRASATELLQHPFLREETG
ncbi:Mitogen-activated protein kinase kinase kinase NPK1 [Phytophthora citrophthora]|uniref:Mitogen-activated protein kinase kinase kinase NPK1 n=1 Tax=Phytophthora citrophthora TaxID=4793 RepID=A0AAD9GYT2_9STRA|nr:Mitogen-activated protein kinase kinase kinase NPK1 [Phytophthora citrophthora]